MSLDPVGSPLLTLARTGAPPLSGQPATGTVADPGAPGAANGTAPPRGSGDMTLIYIVVLMVMGMFVLTLFGQRKERKKREAMLSAVRKHDKVQTIGGVIGAVVEVKPDFVVLKVDEMTNTRMTFARSAIQQILKESKETTEPADR